jgi:hypothetical protein
MLDFFDTFIFLGLQFSFLFALRYTVRYLSVD